MKFDMPLIGRAAITLQVRDHDRGARWVLSCKSASRERKLRARQESEDNGHTLQAKREHQDKPWKGEAGATHTRGDGRGPVLVDGCYCYNSAIVTIITEPVDPKLLDTGYK